MDVEFVNRYTVSKEGQSGFFIDPTRRRAERNVMPRSTGGGRRGEIIRWGGLALAVGIMVVSLAGQMWMFFFMGLVLAMIYGLRIAQFRDRHENLEQQQADRLREMIALQEPPKWTRFIRFGDFIEREDPDSWKQYEYGQIRRITQDRAYITLWMDDDTQVRVYKEGFIIGTLEAFEPFIEEKAHVTDIPEETSRQAAPGGPAAGSSSRRENLQTEEEAES